MIGDTTDISYDSVTKTLVKINQDNFGAVYSFEESDGSMKYDLTIKHTIPVRDGKGESHLVRLDITYRDTDGVFTHSESSWCVIKSFDAPQVTFDADRTCRCISNWLDNTSWANLTKFVARES